MGLALLVLSPGFLNAQNLLPIQWIQGPVTIPTGVKYSPDGKYLFVFGNGPVLAYTVATGAVRCLATQGVGVWIATWISPDDKTILVLGQEQTNSGIAELWDAVSGRVISTIDTKGYSIQCAGFSPDGKSIAIGGQGSSGSNLILFDVQANKIVRTINADGNAVITLAFSKDGTKLADTYAVANSDFMTEAWTLKSGQRIQKFDSGSKSYSPSIAFSPDGSMLAIMEDTAAGSTLATWSLSTGKTTSTFAIDAGTWIYSIAFSPDGKYLAGCGRAAMGNEGVLDVWIPSTGATAASLPTKASSGVYSLVFSPDSKTLADVGYTLESSFSGNSSPLEFWSLPSMGIEQVLDTATGCVATSVAFSPDGLTVAGSGTPTSYLPNSNVISIRKAKNGALVSTLKTAASKAVNSMAYSSNGKMLAVGGVAGTANQIGVGSLELWDLSNGQVKTLSPAASAKVSSVLFTPDGKTLIAAGQTASDTPVFELWSVQSLKSIGVYSVASGGMIACAAVSPNGKALLVGGTVASTSSNGGFLQQWDLATGRMISTLPTLSTKVVESVEFSPNGKTVASTGCEVVSFPNGFSFPVGWIELWDAASGKLLSTFDSGFMNGVVSVAAFSPDSKFLFAGPSGGLRTYRVADRSLIWADGIGGPASIAISPQGTQLCIANSTGSIVVATNPVYSEPFITGIAISPGAVLGGSNATGTVTLSRPAPRGGQTVDLTVFGIYAQAPSSIIIPAGRMSGTFRITTSVVTQPLALSVQASVNGASLEANLNLKPRN